MTMLEELEWQDKDGNRVKFKSGARGCKVTSKINRNDMVLLVNEVVGNLDMNGDGNKGGENLFCEKGFIAQRKVRITSKYFTVIGLANLLGEPLCCIVIIEGKE